MQSWVDKNKGFVLTFLALLVPVVLAFASVQGETKRNKEEICRVDEREKKETLRSQAVDAVRAAQVARMETQLIYIQKEVDKIGSQQAEILHILRGRNSD